MKMPIWIWNILNSCYLEKSILHRFFSFITGDLLCKCCIFYRGVFVGLAIQIIVVLSAYLLGVLFK